MSQFTKKAICETFGNLLQVKSFDKITIKDIVEECGINRNTFYYYYKDIYDLMEDVLLTETKKVLDTQESNHTLEEFQLISTFITNYKTAITHIYYSKSRDIFVSYLFTVSEMIIDNYINCLPSVKNISMKNKKFVCDFYRFSLVGMVINWIKNGMEEDSQQILKKMSDIFENTVEDALEVC